jgi:hypothetical protein
VTQVDPTWIRPEPGWTCGECGFDFDASAPADAPDQLRAYGKRYQAPLTRGIRDEDLAAMLRSRPDGDGTWSALEYACHVRDALAMYDHRVAKILEEDRPSFRAMGRDEAAVTLAYNEQDPPTVGAELAAAADALATRLASVSDDEWSRIGLRDDFEMSVDWISRNARHEAHHHLLDIGRTLRAARGR